MGQKETANTGQWDILSSHSLGRARRLIKKKRATRNWIKRGSSGLSVLIYNTGGKVYRWRAHRGGPKGHHIRPEGLRTGRPQLTAGYGRPVYQPWWTGDEAGEQRPEAMNFAGLLLSTLPKYA